MFLMIKKVSGVKYVLLFTDMMKANNKYMKDFDKNKESSYPNHFDLNNSYGWAMSQKLPVDIFKWVEITPQLSKDFVEKYNEHSDKEYYLVGDV